MRRTPEITALRVAHRTGDPSDANVEVSAQMEQDFASWPESSSIDTSGHPEHAVAAA